jgi:hypothetical protein
MQVQDITVMAHGNANAHAATYLPWTLTICKVFAALVHVVVCGAKVLLVFNSTEFPICAVAHSVI